MPSSKTNIGLLLIIAAIVIFLVWTEPHLNEIQALSAQKEAIEEALSDSRELLEMRDELLAKYNSISSKDLLRFSKILPEKPESTKLMVGLADIAQANGVIINQLSIQEQRGTGASLTPLKYQHALLMISFSASYEGFNAFIGELQKSLRLIDIEQISFSAAGANSYEFSINAKAYFKQ